VFRYHLKDRPVAGIDLAKLAKQTDGYSGADIAHICETAAERALMDSVRRGEPRMIGTPDLEAAIAEVSRRLAPGSIPPATWPCSPTKAEPTTTWLPTCASAG